MSHSCSQDSSRGDPSTREEMSVHVFVRVVALQIEADQESAENVNSDADHFAAKIYSFARLDGSRHCDGDSLSFPLGYSTY